MTVHPMLTLLFVLGILQVNSSTIQQLHIFFRHGERAPTETYPNDPYINYTWAGGLGQLTNKGKLQMYQLGQLIRKMYSDFLPDYYYSNEVQITSSYADRCLMSAQLFVAGLFPPKGDQIWNENLLWQPIPIKYTPRNQDKLIVMKKFCKKYADIFQNVFHTEEIKDINKQHSELYEILTKNTGQEINSIAQVELIYNTLEIELINNLTLPFWIQPQQELLDEMKLLASKSLAIYTHTNYMKRIRGGPFLKKIINDMTHKHLPKLYLYAGHDLSIVNVLRTLGVINLLKPGFGASFAVELHSNSDVKVIYRNDVDAQPEQFSITNCVPSCTLKNLEKILEPLLPIDWENECDNNTQ